MVKLYKCVSTAIDNVSTGSGQDNYGAMTTDITIQISKKALATCEKDLLIELQEFITTKLNLFK